jgi:ANTAR domain
MTIRRTAEPTIPSRAVAAELSLYRLHLMRVGYAVMGIGLAVVKWPLLVTHPEPWPLFDGVVTCILTAMSLLALLGLRYPVRLLPILLFECGWKLIWLSVVAAPKLATGNLDAATQEVIRCLAEPRGDQPLRPRLRRVLRGRPRDRRGFRGLRRGHDRFGANPTGPAAAGGGTASVVEYPRPHWSGQGYLMERERLSAGQAFDRLRRASQGLNVKLSDIARKLAETGELGSP